MPSTFTCKTTLRSKPEQKTAAGRARAARRRAAPRPARGRPRRPSPPALERYFACGPGTDGAAGRGTALPARKSTRTGPRRTGPRRAASGRAARGPGGGLGRKCARGGRAGGLFAGRRRDRAVSKYLTPSPRSGVRASLTLQTPPSSYERRVLRRKARGAERAEQAQSSFARPARSLGSGDRVSRRFLGGRCKAASGAAAPRLRAGRCRCAFATLVADE